MKTAGICLFICLSLHAFAQAPDADATSDQVDSLIGLNRSYVSEYNFEPAFKAIEEAEQLSLALAGPSSAVYARCLYFHGRTFYYAAKYPEAIPYFLQARQIQEQDPGREHADYAATLTGLGNAYRDLGKFEKAAPLYQESLEIREKVLGRTHPVYANALNNIALLYYELGDYGTAERWFLECKNLREEILGKEHPDYAKVLQNLAVLYSDMGLNAKAEAFYRECIDIKAQARGREHPEYALSLQNLGVLYYETNQPDKAEPLFLESNSIWEKTMSRQSLAFVESLDNLALLYSRMGRHETAEALFRESMSLRESLTGTKDANFANTLNNLGALYWDTRQYEKAHQCFQECKAILLQHFDHNHPMASLHLQNAAEGHEVKGELEAAEQLLAEDAAHRQIRLNKAVSFLSEKELSEYTRLFENDLHRMLNFLRLRTAGATPAATLGALCYDNILFYKGYLLTAARQIRHMAASNPEASELSLELKSLRRRLGIEYARPIAEQDRLAIADLEEKANAAEKNLAKQLAGFEGAGVPANWKAVAERLQPEEAAVEFVRFPVNFPHPTDSVLYAALLVRPGQELPAFIPLFEEKSLKGLLGAAHGGSIRGGEDSRGVEPVKSRKTADLYELLWRPIQPHLEGANKIFYSPDGLLHRVSLGAIAIAGKGYLSDHFHLAHVGSTRSLAVKEPAYPQQSRDAVLYGGIRYDAGAAATDTGIAQAPSGGSRGEAWSYLSGTDTEVKVIAGLLHDHRFAATVFSGAGATEESFKSLGAGRQSPRIVHLATHGYFFPDEASPMGGPGEASSAFQHSNNPMLRSGLILAGANQTWSRGLGRQPPQEGREDGILTAYEISQMNLAHTELVVLSACETGLGDIQGNEGVYGLQRAFKIAGARYVLMSLWKVPDEQTAWLMTNFYRFWLDEDKPIPDAFRLARESLKKEGLDPYYWAGFVLLE